jgi:uncharacterized protein
MLMDIDLSNLSEGRSYSFSYAFDVGGLVGERLVVFSEPTRVEGSYTKAGNEFAVKARIFVSAVFNCDRCLTEVKREFSMPANAVFKDKATEFFDGDMGSVGSFDGDVGQSAGVFGGDGYFYEGTTVSLDEMVKEKFILSFPEYVVCRPDCKGLCPVCGCDLNVNQCNCQENQNGDGSGNPFAALKDISSGGKNGGTKKKNF